MKELIGKKCTLIVRINDNSLYYTATVNGISSTHIHITDRYNQDYFFRIADVVEISELK